MIVAQKTSSDPTVTMFSPPNTLAKRLHRQLVQSAIATQEVRYRSSRKHGLKFFDDRCPHGVDCLEQCPPYDLLHLHNTFNLVDFRGFFRNAASHAPVIRTLHDQSFFTGGCHNSWGCERYREDCGLCPQLGSHRRGDISHKIWSRKQRAIEPLPPGRIHIVATSRWLLDTARASSILRHTSISYIPLAIDTNVFKPRDRDSARELLELPPDVRLVLFVANPIHRKEKGLQFVVDALQGIARPDVMLVTVGRGRPQCDVRVPYLNAGYVGDERVLSLYFSAADVLVMPSLQEAFGQVAIEASACGTPVIGFETGGISDIVRHGETGLLVPPGDVEGLRGAIEKLLDDESLRSRMAIEGRRVAEREYAFDVQAGHYVELYQKVLEEFHSDRFSLV